MTNAAMTNTVAILTGASRGLGAALARTLLEAGVRLTTLARTRDAELAAYAEERGVPLRQIQTDLSDPTAAVDAATLACKDLPTDAQRYWLINNAATLAPVTRADALDDARALSAAFNLNVVAPMLLTAQFLTATRALSGEHRVLNISSGAGRNPRTGWSVYCATKAALDMATRVAVLEQVDTEDRTQPQRAQLVSLAPGIIDTDMQAHIRASDPAHFPTRAQFQAFYDDGQLRAPTDTARRIVAFLGRDDFGVQAIADIRDYDSYNPTP